MKREVRLRSPGERPHPEGDGEAAPFRPVTQESSTEAKIALFRKVFHGREDLYALRWETKSGRSGYSLACSNEWRRPRCRKPRVKCGECGNGRWHKLRRDWRGLELRFCLARDRVDRGRRLGHDLGVGGRANAPSCRTRPAGSWRSDLKGATGKRALPPFWRHAVPWESPQPWSAFGRARAHTCGSSSKGGSLPPWPGNSVVSS